MLILRRRQLFKRRQKQESGNKSVKKNMKKNLIGKKKKGKENVKQLLG